MVSRHPSQLYEAFCYLIIFIVLYKVYLKKYNRQNGFLFGTFLVVVFTARFVIEFWKQNQEAFENNIPLDMGQLLSIPFVVTGIILICLRSKKQHSEAIFSD